MRIIEVKSIYYNIVSLYKKANTKTQRALIGYIIKGGYVGDPLYGGAFNLVKEIESTIEVYKLECDEGSEVMEAIVHIAESAMAGLWDDMAFSEREINTILIQLGNLKGKGGK